MSIESPKGVKSKSRRTKIDRQQRMDRVSALLVIGANYEEIGRALGVSAATVSRDVKKLMEGWQKNSLANMDQIVQLEARRLDEMTRGIYANAKAGDVQALDRMLKIMERRAKLLGLDAPTKVAPTDPTGKVEYNSLDGLSDEQLRKQLELLGELAIRVAVAQSGSDADQLIAGGDDTEGEA